MRYGTYGKLRSKIHPYRTSIGDLYSDFLTVGKLDNNSAEWIGGKSHLKRFVYWTLLSDKKKRIILFKRFVTESENVKNKMKEYIIKRGELVVEIANEPNLYPYISPKLYAYYYTLWYDFIKSVDPKIKITNGGYWIFDELPTEILNCIEKLRIKTTSVVEYHTEFLKYIDSNIQPDIINLHFYPWMLNNQIIDKKNVLYYIIDRIADNKDVWITEYGNINPISEERTVEFISKLINKIKSFEKIKRAYYYKYTGVDSKLEEIQKEILKWKSKKAVRFFSRMAKRRGFRWAYKFLPKLFNIIPGRNVMEIMHLIDLYSKRLPLQGIETDGKLNSIGNAYWSKVILN